MVLSDVFLISRRLREVREVRETPYNERPKNQFGMLTL